jgi:Flp pilus assembly protein TadD
MNRKLKAAVRGMAGDAEAWFAIGQAAVEAGEPSEARYALLHAVELAPSDLQRAINAAQLLYQAGCPAEAERLFRHVLDEVPDFTQLRGELARLLLEEGKTTEARDEAEMALFGQPDEVTLLLIAADANERVGQDSRAIEHLCGVLATAPRHLEANRRLGLLYTRTGDRSRAIACWRQVVEQQGLADSEAMTALGIELSQTSAEPAQRQEGIHLLRAVAEAAPGSGAAHANLGMALLAAERLDEAVQALQAARALQPDLGQAHCGLGLAYHRLQRLPEAAEAFAATERLAPQSPAGPFNLGLVLEAQGDLPGARAALARAAVMAPHDREIRRALEQLSAQTPPRGQGAVDASIAGDLKSFQLFDVLELLRMQNKSGSLVVSSRHGAGIVRLLDGQVTSASAPGVRPLGQCLVADGLLTAAQLEAVLAEQRAGSKPSVEVLGAMLLREHLIEEQQLQRVVFAQVLAALAQMSEWSEGAFSFHRDQQLRRPPVSFSVPQVVLEVMRRRDEASEARRLEPETAGARRRAGPT